MKITLKGRFLWIWGTWHVLWFVCLFWVPIFRPEWLEVYVRALYTVFLPLEAWGAWEMQNDPPGTDLGTTLSEFRQFVAQQGKGSDATGWKALAAGTAIGDAVLIWHVFNDVNPLFAAVMATVVWLWLAPHFSFREKVG